MSSYHIWLRGYTKSRVALIAGLREAYPYLSFIEAQHLVGCIPTRLEAFAHSSVLENVKTALEPAGAVLEIEEHFAPFSDSEQYLEAWFSEHDVIEAYGCTYLPSFFRPANIWIWTDRSNNLSGIAQIGSHLEQRFYPAWVVEETHLNVSKKVWRRAKKILGGDALLDAEKWPYILMLDGVRWRFHSYISHHVPTSQAKRAYKWAFANSPDDDGPDELGKLFFGLLPDTSRELIYKVQDAYRGGRST